MKFTLSTGTRGSIVAQREPEAEDAPGTGERIDVRKFFVDDVGESQRTRKGIKMSLDEATAAAEALRNLLDQDYKDAATIVATQPREGDKSNVVVKALTFRDMPGYVIERVFQNNYSKGIWLRPAQAQWLRAKLPLLLEA